MVHSLFCELGRKRSAVRIRAPRPCHSDRRISTLRWYKLANGSLGGSIDEQAKSARRNALSAAVSTREGVRLSSICGMRSGNPRGFRRLRKKPRQNFLTQIWPRSAPKPAPSVPPTSPSQAGSRPKTGSDSSMRGVCPSSEPLFQQRSPCAQKGRIDCRP